MKYNVKQVCLEANWDIENWDRKGLSESEIVAWLKYYGLNEEAKSFQENPGPRDFTYFELYSTYRVTIEEVK